MLHKADVHFMLQKNVKVENSFFQVIRGKNLGVAELGYDEK